MSFMVGSLFAASARSIERRAQIKIYVGRIRVDRKKCHGINGLIGRVVIGGPDFKQVLGLNFNSHGIREKFGF